MDKIKQHVIDESTIRQTVASPTNTYNSTVSDKFIECNGTFSVILPDPTTCPGEEQCVKNIGTGTITVVGSIDGESSIDLPTQYDSINLISNGAVWRRTVVGGGAAGVVAGDTAIGALKYNGTTPLAGATYGGVTFPTEATRLNYDGVLHATGVITGDSGVVLSSTGLVTGLKATLTQTTGTAPLTVSSTTVVTNLNADKVDGADLDTTTTLGTSDVKVPSQNAVKTYVDTAVAGVSVHTVVGDINVSGIVHTSTGIVTHGYLTTSTGILSGTTIEAKSTTDSSGVTTGSGIFRGGLGVTKNIYAKNVYATTYGAVWN